jgi:hypothetical protein
MADSPTGNFSPSVERALGWAQACAALRGDDVRVVTETDLFLGLLLAHPDNRGEVRVLLAHFGLTARDLLPGDYPAVTIESLREAAKTVTSPSPDDWAPQVADILAMAGSLSVGNAQVAHVMSALLSGSTPFRQRLDDGVSRFGIEAAELATEFQSFLTGTTIVDQTDNAPAELTNTTLNLESTVTAGEQIAAWLDNRFPRRPATFASFSSDAVDPEADYIGVGLEADAFAYLIASKALAPPLAIGLFGDWGSGKSFLMSKIRRRVNDLTGLASKLGNADVQIWGNVAEIEFNAWQYVETDLWAALLHHIFGKLTPEQREKMSELDKRRTTSDAEIEKRAKAAADATARVQELKSEAERLSAVTSAAGAALEKTQQDLERLRDPLVTEKLTTRDQARLGQQVAAGAALLGPDALDLFSASRRVSTALGKPAWRQPRYWTLRRLVITALCLVLVPLVALGVQWWTSSPFATLTTSLAALLPTLVVAMRGAAKIAEQQDHEVETAQREVDEKLQSVIGAARKERDELVKELSTVRGKLATAIDDSTRAQREHQELVQEREAITPGRLYTEFLSARGSSDDYRKRLGLVTTIHEDLEKLAKLTEEYNAGQGTDDESPPNRIVLYIDDLDRCPPKRVVEVLEAVHLLLAFKLFVVVVAVDTRWLTHALGEALPTLKGNGDSTAAAPTAMDYVEKIFQVPFWVERLDDEARQRLLRGLLMKSVSSPATGGESAGGTSWAVGPREEELVDSMLSRYGLGLDLDARQLTISPEELAFIESPAPLVAGTPRQVKRFVNSCLLLLAMAPPLSAEGECPTERMAACFMAALHESMPSLAAKLAEPLPRPPGVPPISEPLRNAVDRLPLQFEAERNRLNEWLIEHNRLRPGKPLFEATTMDVFRERWDVIRRMRFEISPLPDDPDPAAIP